MSRDCLKDCNKYVDKLLVELSGCSDSYKVKEAVFSSFNHLNVYFPEAYKHMLKVWGVEDENN